MAVEYPGYGISAGKPSETGLNNDVLVVYSFLVGVMQVRCYWTSCTASLDSASA